MFTITLSPTPALTHTPVPMNRSELWQRLRQARKYADLTQQQLANECGVTRGAIALWESAEPEHRTKPTTEHLITLSKVTGAPLEWLLNDTSDVNELWRLTGEFGAAATPSPMHPPPSPKKGEGPDVLPDLRQGEHLFLFAQTPDQIARKLAQLADTPTDVRAHLVLIGVKASVHAVATPADALSAVVQLLIKND